MKEKQNLNCDLLIIGAGFSGMVAAARASSLGLKTIQAGSSSNLFLASGLFDLLGVYPLDPANILKVPRPGIEKMKIDMPEHPYSKNSYEKIMESFDFLKDFLRSANLDYESINNENLFILTSAGTFKPSFMVPKTFLKGSAIKKEAKRLLLVDFKGFKGFSAKQIAGVIHKTCPGASALTIEIPDLSGDLTPVRLASLFEDDQFLKYLSKKISLFPKKTDLVGIPAVCGITNSCKTMANLERLTRLDCFEIPGLPPSIPGLRLKNAFEKQLSKNNVVSLNNLKLRFRKFENQEFFFTSSTHNMDTGIKARGVILASGRFPGGGLHAKREMIRETVFDLPVCQPGQRNLWHNIIFFHPRGHAINKAGIETDNKFRPLNNASTPAFTNLYATGSILAHNDWVRLKSGSGVSIVTAFTAVNDFYKKISGGDDA